MTKELMLSGIRKDISRPTEAALWALSNGRCYWPACTVPVIVEVRPGIYRKNAQIAHIFGVSSEGPRYLEGLSEADRDAFKNLLLFCTPHHGEVDDRKTGEQLYPPTTLHKWKTEHEGSNGQTLAALGRVNDEYLTQLLLDVFSPPINRLEAIAQQLERTGTVSAQTVIELRQIIEVLVDNPVRPNADAVDILEYAADVFDSSRFSDAVESLADSAKSIVGAVDAMSVVSHTFASQEGEW
jgi:hypothetical protein